MKKALLLTGTGQTTTPHGGLILVACCAFDVIAGMLHILSETTNGSAACAS
jgi:hypothetical protein